jgi:hypothetical protein
MMQVSAQNSIQGNTSNRPAARYQFAPALRTVARNTLLLQDLGGRILAGGSAESGLDKFAQAGDGFAAR